MKLQKSWGFPIALILSLVICGITYAALGDRSLAKGARGPEVRDMQSRLISLGYVVGPLDGIFGPKTQKGVKLFQKEHGLKEDGVAGKLTIDELKRLTAGSTNASGKALGVKNIDVNLLARLVNAEARGEPYWGQVAVAAVVLNRMKDPAFPKTISEIIYQPLAFSGVADGQINLQPQSSAIKAANEAISGVDPSHGALYFFNPAKTSNRFIWSRPQLITIGNHIFAR
ncbi:MAG: spore cortex-lytic enzyme [Desulfitobacteriaceae bacterium]|nr:spore cortex-lytic enzyme [Desulfitobacteriaceae bacterium]MDD4345320.1 spore cortex-lytic enzyme [Desulfitobacteriaceae bacterium]MDD4400357.1 spore cortex-lytic enzyme [Desulfitobacteriaceae bacterium]